MAKLIVTKRAPFKCNHSSVTIQGNITAMRYRNDVIRSVFLLHIRVNLDMMFGRDYASCHAARYTLIMIVANNIHKLRWPAKSLDLNPIDHLLDLLNRNICTQPLQPNLKELTRVCGHSTTTY